jgi:hypothetical protein
MSNTKSKSNKVEPCPCPKETFQDTSNDLNLLQTLNTIDTTIVSFFGNSKLIIGEKSYNLKNYRWIIIIAILLLLILIASSRQTVSPVPIIVNPAGIPIVAK